MHFSWPRGSTRRCCSLDAQDASFDEQEPRARRPNTGVLGHGRRRLGTTRFQPFRQPVNVECGAQRGRSLAALWHWTATKHCPSHSFESSRKDEEKPPASGSTFAELRAKLGSQLWAQFRAQQPWPDAVRDPLQPQIPKVHARNSRLHGRGPGTTAALAAHPRKEIGAGESDASRRSKTEAAGREGRVG